MILKERLVEIVIRTLMNIRTLDVDIEQKNELISILNEIIYVDKEFSCQNKILKYDEILSFYSKMGLHLHKKIDPIMEKQKTEMQTMCIKLKTDMNLLNAEISNYVFV